ncbi:MAG TPA: hypothetical protein VF691_20455 [Cytophagaceae bacterium]|jgi:hypothetical protein
MKKIFPLLLLFTIKLADSYAQPNHIKPNEYEKIFDRTLVIEVLEESPKILKQMEKATKKYPNAITEYKSFLDKYNKYMKIALEKVWTLNKNVVFKTTSEVKALIDSKDTTTVCLYYSESGKVFYDYSSHLYLKVPTLNYTRMEHHNKKIDYAVYLPISFLRPDDAFVESDIFFALQMIQINLDYNYKNDKHMNASAFAHHQALRNKELATKVLLLDEALAQDSATILEIQKHYPYKYKFVKPEAIVNALVDADENDAYLISMPYELPGGDDNFDGAVKCMRLVVDAKNGNIISSIGTHVRYADENLFLDKDFAVVENKKADSKTKVKVKIETKN